MIRPYIVTVRYRSTSHAIRLNATTAEAAVRRAVIMFCVHKRITIDRTDRVTVTSVIALTEKADNL